MKKYLILLMIFYLFSAFAQGKSGFQVLLTTENDFLGISIIKF